MMIFIFFLLLWYGDHWQQTCLIRALFSEPQTRVMAVAAEFQELPGWQYVEQCRKSNLHLWSKYSMYDDTIMMIHTKYDDMRLQC